MNAETRIKPNDESYNLSPVPLSSWNNTAVICTVQLCHVMFTNNLVVDILQRIMFVVQVILLGNVLDLI